MTLPTFNRQPVQGIYIPRSDLAGWRIDIGPETFTNDNPGPVDAADIELDANGCLTTAAIMLKRPRHPIFPAYAMGVKFWALSKSRGLIPVAIGYIGAATEDALNSFTLPVKPIEDISMNDYYDGTLAGASGNLQESSQFLQKNQEVVTEALKDRPKASIGVDHTGRVRLMEPSQGLPVAVLQTQFYAWKSTGLITLPYGTRSRWDGGPGWLKGEYQGIARPEFAERRAVDAGEVTFTEVTKESGPPLVTVAEVTVNSIEQPYGVDPETGQEITTGGGAGGGNLPPVLPGAADPSAGAAQGPQLIKSSVTAQQYAIVYVYDLEAWYTGSSLPGQGESDLIKKLQTELTAAQEAFSLANNVLGPDSNFTRSELNKLNYAKNQIRLGRIGQQDHVSDYEPLTAKLSTGFVIDQLFYHPFTPPNPDLPPTKPPFKAGYSLLTGTSIFISMAPWDSSAIGLNNGEGGADNEGFSDLIHPLTSKRTIKTFDSPLVELDEFSRNTPFMQGTLEIPPDYFRSPMGPALAQILDKKWADSYEDGPPEDEQPPSAGWDGKWYFYICCWWKVVGPDLQRDIYEQ